MLEVDRRREATASIRGYFYQLDAALLEILNSDLDENVVMRASKTSTATLMKASSTAKSNTMRNKT